LSGPERSEPGTSVTGRVSGGARALKGDCPSVGASAEMRKASAATLVRDREATAAATLSTTWDPRRRCPRFSPEKQPRPQRDLSADAECTLSCSRNPPGRTSESDR